MLATTIVLIHGAWLNGASWDPWVERLKSQGYDVIAPSWPYLDHRPSAVQSGVDSRLADVGIRELIAHYRAIVTALPERPILVGHSFGGLIVEHLMDESLGSLGVAICPAPAKGIAASPRALRTGLGVATKWHGGRKIHTISEPKFARTFANGYDDRNEAKHAWKRWAVPAPGRPFFELAYGDRPELAWNAQRPPMLLIGAGEDRTVTQGMVERAAREWTAVGAQTDLQIYEDRSHFITTEPGWEEVEDAVVAWISARS